MAEILSGVPETALWTLYHRAEEARRPDALLRDPEAIRIRDALEYPFRRRFGVPQPAFAVRARAFDQQLQAFLSSFPEGQVVSMGEGLETQRHRVDNGRRRWVSVDLPEAMAVREQFMVPDDRHRHVSASVLAPSWLDVIDPHLPTFFLAQGLFMYLAPRDVREVIGRIADRDPTAIMFDAIPPWLKAWTGFGLPAAPGYVPPRMNWSLREPQLGTLRAWISSPVEIQTVDYDYPRGLGRPALRWLRRWSSARSLLPFMVLIRPTAAPRLVRGLSGGEAQLKARSQP